jgi:hypothetical protein
MAKRLCKLRRHDISRELTSIHKLVAEPKFLCRSCARASADKNSLCKPAPLTQTVDVVKQPLLNAMLTRPSEKKLPQAEKRTPVVSAPVIHTPATNTAPLAAADSDLSRLDVSKKQLKLAKKALKVQKKQLKKLSKALKKKIKAKKQVRKLQKQLTKLDAVALPVGYAVEKRPSVH